MLSFLRDQNSADTPGQGPQGPADNPAAVGATPSAEQGFLTVATRQKRTRKSTTVLAVLFVAGLVCLALMIKKSAPQAASATTNQNEEAKVEAALARLTGIKSEVFGKMDDIVKKFYDFSGVMQVQVNELAKNPFTLEVLLADTKKQPLVVTEQTDASAIWRQQLMQRTKDMKLLSIMRSDQNKSCMIGSKILCEGDSIQGFVVREIGDSCVKLQLSAEQAAGSPGAPPQDTEIILTLSE